MNSKCQEPLGPYINRVSSSWWKPAGNLAGVCSWCDMGPLICLNTTLSGDDSHVNMSDHLRVSYQFAFRQAGKFFQQDIAIHVKLLQSGFKPLHQVNTSLALNPDAVLLNKYEMPCYMLFRRDLHPLLLLLIYGEPSRIHGVSASV
ncbi:hypothetical protein TNCT_379301 [Trichonephila clavata]|uniref:Uncharacterized protein n=1 Tax=Trichonephila clavata TaxID=2740835 RepID=A0A8X6HWR9_TRICU|nr:hypothetical protein TNCT_379301 [Trichonephila clavata]